MAAGGTITNQTGRNDHQAVQASLSVARRAR